MHIGIFDKCPSQLGINGGTNNIQPTQLLITMGVVCGTKMLSQKNSTRIQVN